MGLSWDDLNPFKAVEDAYNYITGKGDGSSSNPKQFNSKTDLNKPVIDPQDLKQFFSDSASAGVTSGDLFTDGSQSTPASIAALAAFNKWKTTRDAGNVDHQTFLDAVNQNPGRQGTILVPTTPNQTKLGQPPSSTLLTQGYRRGGMTVLG